MYRYGIVIIGILFLIYGGIRLGVSSALLIQSFGIIEVNEFQEPLMKVSEFLEDKNPSSLMSLSTLGYLTYLWVMGAALIVGAIGCLKRKRYGDVSMVSFFIGWSLLFVNFQTINPKIFQLFVWALLYVSYLWFRSKEKLVVTGD